MTRCTIQTVIVLAGSAFLVAHNLRTLLRVDLETEIKKYDHHQDVLLPQSTVTVSETTTTSATDTPSRTKRHNEESKSDSAVQHKLEQEKRDRKAPSAPVIGYSITVTKCQPDAQSSTRSRLDQAAVLLYSIHQNSIRNPFSGSKYDYKVYAFVHPEAANCSDSLERIGYQVQIRDSPVLKEEIKGTLKDYVSHASCCQEKEFLKYYAYTLLDHETVVLLDLDCLILKPLDDLFDTMRNGKTAARKSKLQLKWDHANYTKLPDTNNIEAFFTRDYNMVNPGYRQPHQVGVQGGFLVVKPNLEIFEIYKATIIEGNYTIEGWGGALQYGGYYGAAQMQGLCSYFFGAIRPGTSIELNPCNYNFMGDNPRDPDAGNQCKSGEQDCQDCRTVPYEEIKNVHFTVCSKPWWCGALEQNTNRENDLGDPVAFDSCLKAHRSWFQTRHQLEQVWSERDPNYTVTPLFERDVDTLGYCVNSYHLMSFPKTRIEL
jgi:hypothetical protein